MRAAALVAAIALTACAVAPTASTVAQALCTVEDQNAGACVTPYWLAARRAVATAAGVGEEDAKCVAIDSTIVKCHYGWWQSDIWGNLSCRYISCDNDSGEVTCDTTVLTSDDADGTCD